MEALFSLQVLSQVSVSTSVRDVSFPDQILPSPQVLEANDEGGAFVWIVYEMADRQAPGAVFKYWAQGYVLWLGRDQFDVCAYSLSEIS